MKKRKTKKLYAYIVGKTFVLNMYMKVSLPPMPSKRICNMHFKENVSQVLQRLEISCPI